MGEEGEEGGEDGEDLHFCGCFLFLEKKEECFGD